MTLADWAINTHQSGTQLSLRCRPDSKQRVEFNGHSYAPRHSSYLNGSKTNEWNIKDRGTAIKAFTPPPTGAAAAIKSWVMIFIHIIGTLFGNVVNKKEGPGESLMRVDGGPPVPQQLCSFVWAFWVSQ